MYFICGFDFDFGFCWFDKILDIIILGKKRYILFIDYNVFLTKDKDKVKVRVRSRNFRGSFILVSLAIFFD